MALSDSDEPLPAESLDIWTSSDTSEDEFEPRQTDPEMRLPWQQCGFYEDKCSTRSWLGLGRQYRTSSYKPIVTADGFPCPAHNRHKDKDYLPHRLPQIWATPTTLNDSEQHLDAHLFRLSAEEHLRTHFSYCVSKGAGYVLSCTTLQGLREFWRKIWDRLLPADWHFRPIAPPKLAIALRNLPWTISNEQLLPELLQPWNKYLEVFAQYPASVRLLWRQGRRATFLIVPEFRNALRLQRPIKIGNKRVRWEDRLLLVQCSWCCAFGHLRSACLSPLPTCGFCLQTHSSRLCCWRFDNRHQDRPRRCINCLRAGVPPQGMAHAAFNRKACRLLRAQEERMKQAVEVRIYQYRTLQLIWEHGELLRTAGL